MPRGGCDARVLRASHAGSRRQVLLRAEPAILRNSRWCAVAARGDRQVFVARRTQRCWGMGETLDRCGGSNLGSSTRTCRSWVGAPPPQRGYRRCVRCCGGSSPLVGLNDQRACCQQRERPLDVGWRFGVERMRVLCSLRPRAILTCGRGVGRLCLTVRCGDCPRLSGWGLSWGRALRCRTTTVS